MDIITVLQGLGQCLDNTTLRQLSYIVPALLAMTGRVTMLGISRWTEAGGSYRTIQRFYNSTIGWARLNWVLLQHHVLDPTDTILIGGDESIVTKAGDQTYGLDRFFSSLYGKPVPGLAFFSLSLISVKRRTSYPVLMEQSLKEVATASAQKPVPKAAQPTGSQPARPKGRPKGSRNKNQAELTESEMKPYLRHIFTMLQKLLTLITPTLQPVYFVLDGAFGHRYALTMVRQASLHLISKLRHDSALYLPYDGPQKKRGARKKYGPKLDYAHLPARYLKATTLKDGLQTNIYQLTVWHKLFPVRLNVVVIYKLNLKTQAHAHVVLFSSDLTLAYDCLIDYYHLRFQIEFNFRDAKQFWGLEDFMNVKQRPVYNAANLAMFMVNLSHILLDHFRPTCPTFSVIDLKAYFRARKYVLETLKLLPQPPEPIIIDQILANIAQIGRINPA